MTDKSTSDLTFKPTVKETRRDICIELNCKQTGIRFQGGLAASAKDLWDGESKAAIRDKLLMAFNAMLDRFLA